MRNRWLLISILACLPQSVYAQDAAATSNNFIQVTRLNFARWDNDHDGTLVTAEIDAIVSDPKTQGPEAAAIAALKRITRSSRYKLSQFSLPQLEQLVLDGPGKDRPDLNEMFRNGCNRIEQANRMLYASGKPQLHTVHQGRLGNCYCLAPLGAVLHSAPERVTNMFTAQPDGSYQVKLGAQSVRILPPTDAELAQTATNESDGIWVNLYEKGVGEARNALKPPEQRSSSPIDAMARGGSAGTMLSFITGHKIQRFSFAFAKQASLTAKEQTQILDELRAYLSEAMKLRRAMTCGTEKTTTPGLDGNHAYSLLAYDRTTDCVQLWNPHGGQFTPKGPAGIETGYVTKDGMFSVPLTEFVQQFSGMARETDLPAGDEPELPKLPASRLSFKL